LLPQYLAFDTGTIAVLSAIKQSTAKTNPAKKVNNRFFISLDNQSIILAPSPNIK
jgi:hypothetical protein